MDKIFKQLNALPKFKLRRRAELKLRFRLIKIIWQKKYRLSGDFIVVKHFAPAAAVFVALCLVIIIPTYSYASSGVTYGHVLYPIKQTIEKVELALASEPEAKVAKIEKFATRRLAEAEALSEDYSEDNKALINTIEKAVELKTESQKISSQIVEPAQTATPTPVMEDQSKQLETLSRVAQNVGIKTDEVMLDKVSSAFNFIKFPPGQAKKYKRRVATTTDESAMDETETEADAGVEAGNAEESAPVEPEAAVADTLEAAAKAKGWQKKEQAQKNLEIIKREIDKLKDDIDESKYEPDDVETLFERLDDKVEKTEAAIEEESDGTDELIKSVEALKDNGQYFIKEKNWNKSKKSQSDEAEEDKDNRNNKDRKNKNNRKK